MDHTATSLSSDLAVYFTFTGIHLIIAVAMIGVMAFVIHHWTTKR